MDRSDGSLAERVVDLKRSLLELKTSQFTSQDSGMKFIQITPLTTELTLTPPGNFENLVKLEHTFTPDHDEPVILVPTLNIEADNIIMDVEEDKDNSYHRIITFYMGADFAGYADLFSFYHEIDTGSQARKLISVMYYWFDSSLIASIPFRAIFNLRASDSGETAGRGEIIEL